MKITIKNIINENIDITPEEKFINGISNFIKLPYFYNLRVNEVPEELWDRILSKVFKQKVSVSVSVSENYIYDENNNEIYLEDSNGFWWKREYDKNNNEIYYENSDGYRINREFDKNNNPIYYENSDGDWEKREYDSNNNEVYFETSNGYIIDNRPNSSINENIDITPEEKFINGIVKFINIPYFYNLKVTDTPEHLWNRILSKKFNQEVSVRDNYIYNSNNNQIYYETKKGGWEKREFDKNNNRIYYENSNGYWEKRELDKNNNIIYYEDSDGTIRDDRPSSSINENIDITPEEKFINGIVNFIRLPYIYNLSVNEVPKELWNRILSKIFNQKVSVRVSGRYKYIFDSNNNSIYYEDSDGYWSKQEYDSNNNIIYYENSDGEIKDNRPSNSINENVDINPEQRFINGIVNFIRLPYIYNLSVNEVPKELWNRILSKVFKQKVREYNNYLFDSNNNEIYREYLNGYWIKKEYDKNNNLLYFEDSDGDWEKQEFDKNNNRIYSENSNGFWEKQEYDSNNNSIYYEKSNGYWEKKEYDSNNNEIYFEDSYGYILDNRPSHPLNENIDNTPEEKFINGLSKLIKPPYFYNLRVNEVPKELWGRVLSKVYNQEVSVSENYIYDSNNNEIYYERLNGHWSKREFDKNNNKIYFEDSDGYWGKQEFDKNNNLIYFENSNGYIIDKRNINENIDPEEKYVNGIVKFINIPYFYNLKVTDTPEELWDRILSKVYNQEVRVQGNGINNSNNNQIYWEDSDGFWEKREFDKKNNEIYFENSSGYWEKREYDSNNNEVYYENSYGFWIKREYDSNNNRIYYENSNGEWYKQEYDSNNNRIYFEDSDGKIIDNRPSNPLNENIDITPEEKYINGLSNMIRTPYIYNLRVNEVPEELWDRILSKVYNQEVRLSNNYIFDSNNNQIYYEDSDGDWEKREFDKKNNLIYFEDSDGDWEKREYDSNNNKIYYENSDGYWIKREFDKNNNKIYYEDSDGNIVNNRPSSSINENNTI
jgi:hypothetical protein